MSRLRVALLVTGLAVLGYAVFGALADLGGKLGGVLLFLAAVLVVHDAVWLPLVLAAGVLIGRFVPARHRGVIRVAVFVGAASALVALPLVLGRGRIADNPSVLPLNYGRNLALVLLGLAALTTLVLARAPIRAVLARVPIRAAVGSALASSRARMSVAFHRRRNRKDSESRSDR